MDDQISAIDELTGRQVWRKVTERFTRQSADYIEITLANKSGKKTVLRITPEHPLHLEGWNGKPRGDLLAELHASATGLR